MHYNRIREAIRFVITSLALCAQISYADFVVQDSIIHRGLLDTTEESVHILENGLLLVHNAQELIISGDLIVDTGGSFVAVNQIPDGSFSAGAVGDSRFENNGLVRFLNTEAASQIPHNFYLDTFTNTGEFQFFTYGQSNKVELRIETNSFTNEGQMIISQESSDLGSFEILANNEDVSNEGTICLENINITQGAPLNGQGCINLQNSLLVLMLLPNSGNQVYLQGSSTYLVSQYVYGETGIEIYGFYNNAIVGIDATISEFIYYPASGLLELFACEYCYRILLSIGFGYSTDGFEVVDAGGYQLNALRYTWPVPTGRNIPSLCLQCAETPIVPVVEATAIPDLGNQDNAVVITQDSDGYWTTISQNIDQTITSIVTIVGVDGTTTQTHLVFNTFVENELIEYTITALSRSHLSVFTSQVDGGDYTTVTGFVNEYTQDDGIWTSTTDTGYIREETLVTRVAVGEPEQTQEFLMAIYHFQEATHYIVVSVLPEPTAYTETQYFTNEQGGIYTALVVATSDEANWWYTTTRTIPRLSYISTITTGDGDDVVTLIVSAITNDEGLWVTPTSYHTPTSQTHLTEITTTNDLGEESVLTGVYRESTNNRGEWISTVLAGSMEATTVTSRATLTIDELVYTKDVQLVAYNYDETDLFTETIILDDPVAAELSYTVSDGNEVYTMVVRVTSDEANWWYTTTEILERISTTDYSVQSDNETSEANETTESGVQIVASESDDQSEIEDVPSSTITSGAEYGGGDAQTLIEVLTYTDESGVVDVATFLLEVELVDVVVWVTRTYTNILQTTTFTLPSSVNTHETQVTDPVRVVGYNFEGFGFFYETFALASPAQFTKTLAIETDDGATSFMLQIVTSDDSYMWYTTIEQALLLSYTSTVIVSDEDSSFHTGEVNVFTNDMGAWTTQTSFSTPYSRTYYETESTSTGIDGENVGAMNLIEVKRTQMLTLVSVSYTEVLETTTFESVIEASLETFTVQVIGLNFLNFGFVFQTVEIQASTSETIFSIESEYDEPSTEAFDTWESESEFVSIPDTFISLDNTESQLEFTVDNTSASEISTKASDYLLDSTFYLVTTTENDVSLTTEITNGNIVTSEPLVVLDSQLESIAAYLSTITTSNYEGQSLIATILMQLSEQNVETWTTITHSAIEVTTFISHRTSTMADGNSSLATKSVMVVAHSYESYVPALQTFDLFDPNEWAITTTIDDGVLQNTVLLVVTSNSDDQYWYATVDTASPSSFTTTVEFLFSFSYEGLELNTAVVNKFTDEYGVWVTSTSLASPIAQTYLQSIRGVNEVNQITTVLYLVEVSSTTILSGITVTQPFAEETTMANFEELYDAQPTDETFYVEQSYIDSDRSESRSDRSESRSDHTTGFDKVQETRSEGVMSRESQKFGSSPALQIDVGSFTGTGKETVISTLTQTNRLVDCEVSTFGATKSIYVTRGENAASVSNSKEGQAWDQITSKYVRSSNNGGIDIGQNTDSESISITLTISHSTSMQSSFTSPAKGPNSFYESYLFDGAGFAGVRYNLSPFAKQFSILVLLLSFIM